MLVAQSVYCSALGAFRSCSHEQPTQVDVPSWRTLYWTWKMSDIAANACSIFELASLVHKAPLMAQLPVIIALLQPGSVLKMHSAFSLPCSTSAPVRHGGQPQCCQMMHAEHISRFICRPFEMLFNGALLMQPFGWLQSICCGFCLAWPTQAT